MEKPVSSNDGAISNKHTTGGISYVSPSEDESLSSVAYRADSGVTASTSNEKRLKALVESDVKHIRCRVVQVAKKELKDYVLCSDERRGSLSDVSKFKEIDFSRNNVCTVLHFSFSESELLVPTRKASKAEVLLALWTYTSPPSRSHRIRDRLCLELFVDERLWKTLKPETRSELKCFQLLVEKFVREKLPSRRLSSIRDGPRLELTSTIVEQRAGGFVARQWHFPKDAIPDDAEEDVTSVGVTTYTGVFSLKELQQLEHLIDDELISAPKDRFLPDTAQSNWRGNKLTRTKFFFGSSYIWGDVKVSKDDPTAGVRANVDPVPAWLHELVEERLVSLGLVKRDWLNSFAVNVYHDGSLGLASHMDDTSRFEQPIFSLRLYSPSRLTFGAQKQGMTNPLFFVPMPRGCITVMEEDGYAANKVTHCIRPADMSGKSAAIIMRRVRPRVLKAAQALRVLQEQQEQESD